MKKYLVEGDNEEEYRGFVVPETIKTLPSVNHKVEIFWPKDDKYYPGTVTSIEKHNDKRHIKYDNGDEATFDFT